MTIKRRGTLLLYIQVHLHRHEGRLHLEDQALSGLRAWAEHFDRVVVMLQCFDTKPPPSWTPIDEHPDSLDRVRLVPIPGAYRPDRFLLRFFPVRRLIAREIAEADYLVFSVGGLFGGWGWVAADVARRLGRPYAVWTDRVEAEVLRRLIPELSGLARLRALATVRPQAFVETRAVRGAALGLFHGEETYAAYAPLSPSPHVVDDIHLEEEDHIGDAAFRAKVDAASDTPLRIVYVGRAESDKGALDWVEALAALRGLGVEFTAEWIGAGPQLDAMSEALSRRGLSGLVTLRGFVSDRRKVFEALRAAHLMMFCHRTPESPRCLIEALVSASPIIGYRSAYPEGLLRRSGGGVLTPLNDPAALAGAVAGLDRDRRRLARLTGEAREAGRLYTRSAVFRHRSDLIKAHLPPPAD